MFGFLKSKGELAPPPELLRLLKARLWPASHEQACEQNCVTRIANEDVHRLVPSENEIFLYPAPWQTLARDHEASRKQLSGTDFFAAYDKTLEQIDPLLALFIADFGHGSDAPIALDYRSNSFDPAVIGLKWKEPWRPNDGNRWIELSPSFSSFVETLKLWHLPKFVR